MQFKPIVRLFHKAVPTMIAVVFAAGYRAAQELGYFPKDEVLFPALVLVSWFLFLYWLFAGPRAFRIYGKQYKSWAQDRRFMAYSVAILIGVAIGGLTGAGSWKLFESHRQQLAKLRSTEAGKKEVAANKAEAPTPSSSPVQLAPTPQSATEFAEEVIKQMKSEHWERAAVAAPPAAYGGFVQYESKSLVADNPADVDAFVVGKRVRMNFTFDNRGQRPVLDSQSWGLFAFVDPQVNPGSKLRAVLLNGIKAGYKKFTDSGSTMGVGISGWNTAVSEPLTREQIDGLRAGSLRIHLMLGGAWKDESGRDFYWTSCEWTNWPQVPFASSVWHTC
jgi:hypothetical protein